MTTDIRLRVKAGAAWLDEHDPGWWREDATPVDSLHASYPIDVDRLDLADPCGCVAGRRWGHFGNVSFGEADPRALGMLSAMVGAHLAGLSMREIDFRLDAEYRALTAEWVRVIRARRAEVGGGTP